MDIVDSYISQGFNRCKDNNNNLHNQRVAVASLNRPYMNDSLTTRVAVVSFACYYYYYSNLLLT